MSDIRLKLPGESFWAWQYPDLPENQAEINNFLLSETYAFGDRVEFDEDRNVTRLIKTREQVREEMEANECAEEPK
jgi:hypothetical protein